MARSLIEGPAGQAAADSTIESGLKRQKTERYIATLTSIRDGSVQRAQAAREAGKTETARVLTGASVFKALRVEGALHVRDSDDSRAAAAELVDASERHRLARHSAGDPEAAVEFEREGALLQGMAEAGAHALDLIHPLPEHERWIDVLIDGAAARAQSHPDPLPEISVARAGLPVA